MTQARTRSDALSQEVEEARERYASLRPVTAALHDRAREFLPG